MKTVFIITTIFVLNLTSAIVGKHMIAEDEGRYMKHHYFDDLPPPSTILRRLYKIINAFIEN